MKTTETISKWLETVKPGTIFGYSDVLPESSQKEAVIKALNRMAQAGKISKLSKGKFYKPEKTIFGELRPDQSEIVKDLLVEKGKSVGYLTGLSIFSNLGLTTQVSNTIQIGRNDLRAAMRRERYRISFIKQKNEINANNIRYLQLLDIIRLINKIPDRKSEAALQFLIEAVDNFSQGELNKMTQLAMKYPPSTRAVLGAIYENVGHKKAADELQRTLNPVSTYKVGLIAKLLSNAKNWNLK